MSVPVIRSLQARKEIREKAWQVDGWAETVSKASVILIKQAMGL
jgi:hypothetical protein